MQYPMKIRFIGAVGTVTGSCTLLEHNGEYFLVDCGGGLDAVPDSSTTLDFKPLALRSMFLTHAHLDHCGLIPALIAQGFRGRIYCTAATRDLTLNALLDAVVLGKCDAQHIPALNQFECPDEHPDFAWGKYLPAATDLTVAFARTAHILGSVSVSFQFATNTTPKVRTTISFSGDIGCNEDGNCFQSLLAKRYQPDAYPSYLVLESTYGARNRPFEASSYEERMKALAAVLEQALSLSSEPLVLIPCFTLHRTQELMADFYCLLNNLPSDIKSGWAKRLNLSEEEAPLVDVAIESALAWKHTAVYRRELPRVLNTKKRKPIYLNGNFAKRAGVSEESISAFLDNLFSEPTGCSPIQHGNFLRFGKIARQLSKRSIRIVIAGSGMCQGGRIIEHLKDGLPNPGVLVVLMGFQAPETPGSQLRRRIDEPNTPLDLERWKLPDDVKATIADLGKFYSGHADQSGLVKFALHKDAPYPFTPLKRIFLNHGDQTSREELKAALLAFSAEHPKDSRGLATVELPKRHAGWFDLNRDMWTDDIEPDVDALESVVWALHRKVRRLEEELATLRNKEA
jgi:metallo-beta-lactamase family protein